MIVSHQQYGPLHFELSKQVDACLIPGVPMSRASYLFGSVFVQVLASPLYTLHYYQLQIREPVTLFFSNSTEAAVQTRLCLEGDMECELRGEQLLLRKDQFFLYAGEKESSLLCEAGKRYRFIEVCYPAAAIDQVPYNDAAVQELLMQQTGQSINIPPTARYASNHLLQITRSITERRLPDGLAGSYRDKQMAVLLIELLMAIQQAAELEQEDDVTIATCRLIGDFIIENIHAHFTIQEISVRFKINELYIKKGFKELYGMGPFEFLREQRMYYARDLLLSTDIPIKQLSKDLGYEYHTNFIHFFKLFFGYTPASLRKGGGDLMIW
jgi:AraC-like DNA-binding protein